METPKYNIYMGEFRGKPCRYIEDKSTGERTLFLEDVAKCLGFKNSDEMLSVKALMKNVDTKSIGTVFLDEEE